MKRKMTSSRIATLTVMALLAVIALLIALPAIGQNDDYGVSTNLIANTATPVPPTSTPAPTATSVLDTLVQTMVPTVQWCPIGQVYNPNTDSCEAA